MNIRNQTLLLLSALSISACSSDDKADGGGDTNESAILSLWSDADAVTTTFAAADVASFLNGRSELAKLSSDSLLLPQPETAKLSRLATGIDSCIAKKLDDLPVQVTSDSLRLEYSLDLTALCDEAPKTAETVTEISNVARGLIVIGCPGGDFRRFAGKTLKEARASGGTCVGAQLAWYALDMQYAARKVTKTTVGTTTTTQVSVQEGHTMWSKGDGKACRIRRHPENNNIADGGECRLAFSTKTFSGTPENAVLPASSSDGPRVIQGQEDFGTLNAEPTAPYYSNGTTGFVVNGWRGTLTYSNGWAPPRWEAAKDGVTASGTLGQAVASPVL